MATSIRQHRQAATLTGNAIVFPFGTEALAEAFEEFVVPSHLLAAFNAETDTAQAVLEDSFFASGVAQARS